MEKNHNTNTKKASSILRNLLGDISFSHSECHNPSSYVKWQWQKYLSSVHNSTFDKETMFELIIGSLFIRENILPLNFKATVALVPNVEYDLVLFCKQFGPIAFSIKADLEKGYKQLDLEAIALKYSNPRAKSYLLTLDEHENEKVNRKIKSGDVIGLNKSVYCMSSQLDELISDLKTIEFEQAGSVPIIESNLVVTSPIL